MSLNDTVHLNNAFMALAPQQMCSNRGALLNQDDTQEYIQSHIVEIMKLQTNITAQMSKQ